MRTRTHTSSTTPTSAWDEARQLRRLNRLLVIGVVGLAIATLTWIIAPFKPDVNWLSPAAISVGVAAMVVFLPAWVRYWRIVGRQVLREERSAGNCTCNFPYRCDHDRPHR